MVPRLKRVNAFFGLLVLFLIWLVWMSSDEDDGLDLGWLLTPAITTESLRIACYSNTSWNTMKTIAETPVRVNKSIFFVETSCHDGGLRLTPRMTCALESAAFHNPEMDVYLLVPAPVDMEGGKRNLEKHVRNLLDGYPNIHFRHVDMATYFDSTPLDEWYRKGWLRSSRWPNSHASDLLRYTTLWKYGGIYMDLDIVLIKPFNGASNFSGAESATAVAAGVMSFSRGHPLANACMQQLRFRFRGYDWGYNGPGVITRALKIHCGVSKVTDMTPERCGGFIVHDPSVFYPIPWKRWSEYFEEPGSEITMKLFENSQAIHVWNKFSHKANVTVGSRQPYAIVASQHCPRVYSSLDEFF